MLGNTPAKQEHGLAHSELVKLTSCSQYLCSLLQAVDPVVLGKVRAKQFFSDDKNRSKNLGILMHGDGSFSGQGVVYETLDMQALPDFSVGGTIHVVVNNQVSPLLPHSPVQLQASWRLLASSQSRSQAS